ncbi:MAG: hypothetical protein AAF289_02120 [Cyanobacteria bacterium P01_A01_bin.135]
MQTTQSQVQHLQARLQSLGQQRQQTRQSTTTLQTAQSTPDMSASKATASSPELPPTRLVSLPALRSEAASPPNKGILKTRNSPAGHGLPSDISLPEPWQQPSLTPAAVAAPPPPQPGSVQAFAPQSGFEGMSAAASLKAAPATGLFSGSAHARPQEVMSREAINQEIARTLLEPPSEPIAYAETSTSPEEAAQLADALRQRRAHGQQQAGLQTGSDYVVGWAKRLRRSLTYPLKSQSPARPTGGVSADESSSADLLGDITLQDAMLWIAASAAVRVGLDLLLLTYSGLWLPVMALIVAPAAIAIYRTMVNPQTGFALGRQLLLIMIGLLLGGRML